jgi:outer membrane protein assembly factor BamB
MKLYFFPALLPLASALPALLSLVGALAAWIHPDRTRRSRQAMAAGAASLLPAAIAVLASKAPAGPASVERLPPQETAAGWNQLLPRPPLSAPAWIASRDLLVFGTRARDGGGSLDALSTRDGTLKFVLRMNAPVVAQPVSDPKGQVIYSGEGLHDTPRSRLVAARLADGHPLWQREFAGHIESSPLLSADGTTLWGCAGDGGAFAVEASNGTLRWARALGHCDTTPALVDRTLYVLAESSSQPPRSRLWALKAENGEAEWSVELEGQPWGTPLVFRGSLLVTTGLGDLSEQVGRDEGGWLHSIDLSKRAKSWSRALGGMPLLSNLVLERPGGGWVIQALKKGQVLALDTETGAEEWRTKLESPLLSQPAMFPSGKALLALGFDGTLYELDAVAGQVLARRRAGAGSTSGLVVSPTHAFALSREGIQAVPLDPRTGGLR